MPLFNAIFVFYYFRVFVKLNNMFPVLALRSGQSYNSLIERKHSTAHDQYWSERYIITEETVAHLILLVVSSLDASVNSKRDKLPIYEQTVRVLKKMDGVDGRRDWRAELAEVLTKWHDTCKHVTKTKRVPTADMALSASQVAEVDDRLL
jgi:hypothetical protein